MAKKDKAPVDPTKEARKSGGVTPREDKFYCSDCGAELIPHHDCPSCGRQIEWDRGIFNLRRGSNPQ